MKEQKLKMTNLKIKNDIKQKFLLYHSPLGSCKCKLDFCAPQGKNLRFFLDAYWRKAKGTKLVSLDKKINLLISAKFCTLEKIIIPVIIITIIDWWRRTSDPNLSWFVSQWQRTSHTDEDEENSLTSLSPDSSWRATVEVLWTKIQANNKVLYCII